MKCSEKPFQGKLITFPERRCRHIKKPNLDLEETCQRGACPAHPGFGVAAGWYPSPWQQVSARRFPGDSPNGGSPPTAAVREPARRKEQKLRFWRPNDLPSLARATTYVAPSWFRHL